MKYILFLFCLCPALANACPQADSTQLGHFIPSKNNNWASKQENNTVVLDLTFIDDLVDSPSVELFNQHRYELYYLVAREHKQALLAGLKILAYILKNPTYITECDRKVEIHKKEEIAHTLSRSENFSTMVCRLSDNERKLIFSYYKNNRHLYQLSYDAPWEFNSCPQKTD